MRIEGHHEMMATVIELGLAEEVGLEVEVSEVADSEAGDGGNRRLVSCSLILARRSPRRIPLDRWLRSMNSKGFRTLGEMSAFIYTAVFNRMVSQGYLIVQQCHRQISTIRIQTPTRQDPFAIILRPQLSAIAFAATSSAQLAPSGTGDSSCSSLVAG